MTGEELNNPVQNPTKKMERSSERGINWKQLATRGLLIVGAAGALGAAEKSRASNLSPVKDEQLAQITPTPEIETEEGSTSTFWTDVYRAQNIDIEETFTSENGRISMSSLQERADISGFAISSLDAALEIAKESGFEVNEEHAGLDIVNTEDGPLLVPSIRTSEGLILTYDDNGQRGAYLFEDIDKEGDQSHIVFAILTSQFNTDFKKALPVQMVTNEKGEDIAYSIVEFVRNPDTNNIVVIETPTWSATAVGGGTRVRDAEGTLIKELPEGTKFTAVGTELRTFPGTNNAQFQRILYTTENGDEVEFGFSAINRFTKTERPSLEPSSTPTIEDLELTLHNPDLIGNPEYVTTASMIRPDGKPLNINVFGDRDLLTQDNFKLFEYTEESRELLQDIADAYLVPGAPTTFPVVSINAAASEEGSNELQDGDTIAGESYFTVNLDLGITVILTKESLPESITVGAYENTQGVLTGNQGIYIEPRTDGRLVMYVNTMGMDQNVYIPEWLVRDNFNRVVYGPLGYVNEFMEAALAGETSFVDLSSRINAMRRNAQDPARAIGNMAMNELSDTYAALPATLQPVQ